MIAQARFNDFDAADELFKIALKQPNPVKALKADYGRLLLIAKRPRDAQEVLDQAVKETPDFSDAWTNLAWARFQNGDAAAACAAAEEAAKKRPVEQFDQRPDRGEERRAVQIALTISPSSRNPESRRSGANPPR